MKFLAVRKLTRVRFLVKDVCDRTFANSHGAQARSCQATFT